MTIRARPIISVDSAFAFLKQRSAHPALIRHSELVLEVADDFLKELKEVGATLDADIVRVGSVLHDAGKILYWSELHGEGDAHEAAGQRLLADHDWPERVNNCAIFTDRLAGGVCGIEELLVGLADTLWKGARNAELELAVIDRVAQQLGRERWDLFVSLDSAFERIAAGGHERLERSKIGSSCI